MNVEDLVDRAEKECDKMPISPHQLGTRTRVFILIAFGILTIYKVSSCLRANVFGIKLDDVMIPSFCVQGRVKIRHSLVVKGKKIWWAPIGTREVIVLSRELKYVVGKILGEKIDFMGTSPPLPYRK